MSLEQLRKLISGFSAVQGGAPMFSSGTVNLLSGALGRVVRNLECLCVKLSTDVNFLKGVGFVMMPLAVLKVRFEVSRLPKGR
jgi:hypothetical protein